MAKILYEVTFSIFEYSHTEFANFIDYTTKIIILGKIYE